MGTKYQPEDDATPDPGRLAFVTEVRSQVLGGDDVYQGCTVLTSPTWEVSGHDGVVVEYSRWFATPGLFPEDRLVIELSNNGGAGYAVIETVTAPETQWTASKHALVSLALREGRVPRPPQDEDIRDTGGA